MDDGDDRDARMGRQVGVDRLGRDRVVVRHLDLVQLGAERPEPVAEALAEDARHEVEARGPGPDEAAGGRLQAEDRLALHEDDLVARAAEDAPDLRLGRAEALLERGIVVVGDGRSERGLDPARDVVGPRAQGQVSRSHLRTSFSLMLAFCRAEACLQAGRGLLDHVAADRADDARSHLRGPAADLEIGRHRDA